MKALTATALVILATIAVVLSVPTPEVTGGRGSKRSGPAQSYEQRRTNRQAPAGMDILSQVSQAFQQHMQQKQERVMDVVDSVGKALGSIGDSVRQGISDHVAQAGQRSAAPGYGGPPGGDQLGEAGSKVGEVLTSIGDVLRKVSAPDADGQRSSASGQSADLPANPADMPVGQILASLGDKLRRVGSGDADGQRALGEVGQQVGSVLSSIGDTIHQVIRQRQEGSPDDDVEDVARLVPRVDVPPAVPCARNPPPNNGSMMMDAMRSMARGRRRGRRHAMATQLSQG